MHVALGTVREIHAIQKHHHHRIASDQLQKGTFALIFVLYFFTLLHFIPRGIFCLQFRVHVAAYFNSYQYQNVEQDILDETVTVTQYRQTPKPMFFVFELLLMILMKRIYFVRSVPKVI